MRPTPPTAALLLMLAALAAMPASAQYKVIGPDGRVTYTDRPTTDPAHRVQALRKSGAGAGDDAAAPLATGLPQALRQPVARFPVTLITTPDCGPCDTARQQLQRRGVPYTELGVATPEDQQALQRLTGGLTVPSVSIGSQVMRGWQESDWMATLDLAGYPKESALPKGWRWAAVRPLAAPRPAAEPADERPAPSAATAPAAPPPVPTESIGPVPQIRF
ncbi:glutaredoxin family protein [Ideonella sp. DXS22W]|uniref:Glutaredoxin family protein n=1 Tax=Pseudaquabacterium inlustre TaxID=2984192 RepID=A0ABU9CL47_9BURK